LRDRREDIAPLANYFLRKYQGLAIHPVEGISEDAMRVLTDYSWPCTMRELEYVIQCAVVQCRDRCESSDDLSVKAEPQKDLLVPVNGEILPLREAMKKVERQLILSVLKASGGNRKESARRLGINRTTLYNKLHEHGIMDV